MIQQSHFWLFIQKSWKQDLKRDISTPRFIAALFKNSQDVETTNMSTDVWMSREKGLYTQNRILLSLKKKEILSYATTWINLEGQVVRDSTYMQYPKQSNSEKQSSMVVARSWSAWVEENTGSIYMYIYINTWYMIHDRLISWIDKRREEFCLNLI